MPASPARSGSGAANTLVVLLPLVTLFAACDADYPEVVVVNRISENVVIRDPSFSGCRWNVTLNFGDTTIPKRCLPGSDKVHFQKLDLAKYAADLATAGTETPTPMWFNYETADAKQVEYGDFNVIDVTADDLEQDFSIPGPYGH